MQGNIIGKLHLLGLVLVTIDILEAVLILTNKLRRSCTGCTYNEEVDGEVTYIVGRYFLDELLRSLAF